MVEITTDPRHPDVVSGPLSGETTPRPQNKAYLVLSDAELALGYVKPYRDTYRHATCGATTTMPTRTAQTYARDPWFYGLTYCCTCMVHRPLEEFDWLDGESMASEKWSADEIERIVALRAGDQAKADAIAARMKATMVIKHVEPPRKHVEPARKHVEPRQPLLDPTGFPVAVKIVGDTVQYTYADGSTSHEPLPTRPK